MNRLVVLSVLAAATLLAACQDPVHNQDMEALGDEAPGVPKGPLHRPGQPCLVCHGDQGPASMLFSLAGTVFQYAPPSDPTSPPSSASTLPASDVLVHFRDSNGTEFTTGTNCAGNFFVQPSDFTPAFPVAIWLEYAGLKSPMTTAAFREGSCAKCHRLGARTFDSPGPVYFRPNAAANMIPHPPGACQ